MSWVEIDILWLLLQNLTHRALIIVLHAGDCGGEGT